MLQAKRKMRPEAGETGMQEKTSSRTNPNKGGSVNYHLRNTALSKCKAELPETQSTPYKCRKIGRHKETEQAQ
jgi:hypothetical protein